MADPMRLRPLLLALLLPACAMTGPEPGEEPTAPAVARAAVPAMTGPAAPRLRRAVLTAPALASGSARIRGAEAAVRAERAGFLPQLSIGADAWSSDDRSGAYLQLSQLVFDAGGTAKRVAAGRAEVAARRMDRVAEAAAAALQAAEAWASLRHAQEIQRLAGDDVAAHDDFLSRTRQRVESGVATEAEALLAQSRRDGAAAALAEAGAARGRAEARFVELFGETPEVGLAALPHPPAPADAAAALRSSPRLAALAAAEQAAEARLAAARAGRLPQILARATADRDDVAGGLSVQYALASGGRRQAAVAEAEAAVAETAATRTALEAELTRRVSEAVTELEAGRLRLTATTGSAETAARALAAVEAQLATGRSRISDLLDAQRDATAARRAHAGAERDLTLAGFALLSATGEVLPYLGIDPAEIAGGAEPAP